MSAATPFGAAEPSRPPGDARRRSIATRLELANALRDAFDTIGRLRPREVFLSDEDFAAWPLGERAVVERLTAWASADRRLVLIARRFDTIARRHPRWVAWRRTWSHVVVCLTHTERVLDPWPTLLAAPGAVGMRLIDRDPPRGWVSSEPHDVAACKEQFDAVSQRSVGAFPASTLGL